MGKKKVTGYIFHNGMWYKQYASGKRETATDKEIQEHIDRVEKERESRKKGD